MSESKDTRRFCDELERFGVLVQCNVGSRYGTDGWPDRTLLWRGKCVFVEFKATKGLLSALQKVRIGEIRARGVPVFVARFLPCERSEYGADPGKWRVQLDGAATVSTPEAFLCHCFGVEAPISGT
jgi:hypothetical protein